MKGRKGSVCAAAALASLALVAVGIFRGELKVVQMRATNICLECIELGKLRRFVQWHSPLPPITISSGSSRGKDLPWGA